MFDLASIRALAQIRFTKPLDKLCLSDMKKRLPSINALRSFEAAARHQSFTLAAAELSVSPAAIGFQVKHLEEDLGAPLFIRKHRAIQSTPEGAALMRRLANGFEIIEAAWNDMQVPAPQKTLKVTAPVAVVKRWLFDEITPQAGSGNEVQISWDVSHVYRALDGSGADAAIRNTITPDPDLFSEPLLRQWFTPLARPDVAQKIKTPSDLLRHKLINVDFGLDARPGSTAWKPWFKSRGLEAPERYEMICADTITAVDMAVKTGHIAIGGYFVATDHIKSGRLVAPFNVAVCPQAQLWFLCEKGREDEPEMIWFRQTVQDCAMRLRASAVHFKMFNLNGEKLAG
jgi:LysR family transcriptional regulator, glycine cleavage system transcriptional activator